jgi:hypothetical protein
MASSSSWTSAMEERRRSTAVVSVGFHGLRIITAGLFQNNLKPPDKRTNNACTRTAGRGQVRESNAVLDGSLGRVGAGSGRAVGPVAQEEEDKSDQRNKSQEHARNGRGGENR